MKRPPSLQFNDRAVIISPAGKIDGYIVQGAAAVLENWGLRPEISENALCEAGRFSGSVEQRLSDLQKAFDDPDIKLVFCSRGGYGVVHLLEKLDFSGIKKNPKWVVGYSDITLLHATLQTCGIASLHAPMAQHFSDEGSEDIAVRYTKTVLSGQPVSYRIPVAKSSLLNRKGESSGRLFGGNLSVFCSLLGSQYAKIPNGGILFIEDIGEVPYRVDRMIYQLKIGGVFSKINGLIIGQFTGYEEDPQMYSPLFESIREAVSEYDFPLCFDFPVGHVKLNFPLIMGGTADLKVEEDFISFIQ
ncbi:LD-carboxypeptidase [Proteiniphilum sp.]|uniref:S66 peptidase family protein n=1 Tax=Proteiniphilum sp. TaxID=1926877 RepID=UPI002B2148FC|nr:LD-carboxypeptidase [Proteiniphilum sp.]MEA4917604.1 LD-carboxypeptidase [Proteiniphilum sp.]